MPKVSVYLPDDLYGEAKARQLPLSALAQQAVERALATSRRTEWVSRVRARPPRHDRRVDTATVLSAVRDEFDA